MTTRIYTIRRLDGTGSPRMVEASSPSTALRHVAGDTFAVNTPTPIEAVYLMQAGVELEQIKSEPITTGMAHASGGTES